MKHRRIHLTGLLVTAFSFSMLLLTGNLIAQEAEPGNNRPIDANKARVVEYWTSDRRAAAVPRDLVIDPRGLGYMRLPNGTLQPYGHQISATAPNSPAPMMGRPPSNDDTTPPDILGMNPPNGAIIGAVQTFSADVTDANGVKSVTFNLQADPSSPTESFAGSSSGGDNWSVALQGFVDGEAWTWWVTAKDNVRRGGNTADSRDVFGPFSLTVATDPGNGGGDTETNGIWTTPGDVKNAAGRIFFEMPRRSNLKGPWNGFVCSGTVATDDTTGRSVIITAAHCVYDDVNKAFARNILFIPNQQDTTGLGTDSDCGNDPIGCWAPTFGAVDENFTTPTFPDNIAWDYGYYAVPDMGAHSPGLDPNAPDALDAAAGSLVVNFGAVDVDDGDVGAASADFTHALGYSLSHDPEFRYCAEDMTMTGAVNWLLPSCGLSGGASGGPWVQRMDTVNGSGPIISINSWGSTGSPGIAGPKLDDTLSSAACVFGAAKDPTETPFASVLSGDGNAGFAVVCP